MNVDARVFTFFSRVVIIKFAAVFSALLYLIAGPGMSNHADLRAQYLDPYRRINDPLAIADLGGGDTLPSWHQNVIGAQGPLDADGFNILAGDTGVGIIRNFWSAMNNGNAPTTGLMRLWVDDSLLADATLDGLFEKSWGNIRPPFDTMVGGAYNMDIQIPYKHSFRWTARDTWFFRAATWQRIDTSVQRLPSLGSLAYNTFQRQAEERFRKPVTLPSYARPFHADLHAGDTTKICDLTGPACIDGLEFQLPNVDSLALSSIWIEMFWDGSATASVSVPLAQFFGVAQGWHDLHAFFISVDSATHDVRCILPMPFKVSARVLLINNGTSVAAMQGGISYREIPWNRDFGYFEASRAITRDVPFRQFHHALHIDGRGKYIGLILNCEDPHSAVPSYLEGDIYVRVDSIPFGLRSTSCHYTGTEDYTSGGWYFMYKSYTHPFYGCPDFPRTLYRFHINDTYNFGHSLDVNFGHGYYDDMTVTLSTIAYYYKHWTPFQLSSDSIGATSNLTISGAGYSPLSDVVVDLDTTTIYHGVADSKGKISLILSPSALSWPTGSHWISVNAEKNAVPLVILAHPQILFKQDSVGPVFLEGDSIEVRGYGYKSNEQVSLFVGDSIFSKSVLADSTGTFRLKCYLPWVPEGTYHLSASRGNGERIISDSQFYVSRVFNYEFETLPMVEGTGEYSYLSFPDKHYSQGSIRFCQGNWNHSSHFAFQFYLPLTDSFDVTLFATTGNRYCSYRTFIDGKDLGTHDWYRPYPWLTIDRDSVVMPNVYLTKGSHTIRFVTDSWHDSTVEYSIGPDNMHLKPLSPTSRAAISAPGLQSTSFSFYPDPVSATSLHLTGLSDSASEIELFDGLGREVFATSLTINAPNQMVALPLLTDGHYWLRVIDGKLQITKPITILRWQ